MNGRRKPRKERAIERNVMGMVKLRASRLTADELQQIAGPTYIAQKALREGVASDDDVTLLDSAMYIGIAIEDTRVVKGLRVHLQDAQAALHDIRQRAMSTGNWVPTPLYFHELDRVSNAVDLHLWQLEHLSAAELQKIIQRLDRKVTAGGGDFIRTGASADSTVRGMQA